MMGFKLQQMTMLGLTHSVLLHANNVVVLLKCVYPVCHLLTPKTQPITQGTIVVFPSAQPNSSSRHKFVLLVTVPSVKIVAEAPTCAHHVGRAFLCT